MINWTAAPLTGQLPGVQGNLQIIRDVRMVSGNKTIAGTRLMGTYFGIMVEKSIMFQDNAGGAVTMATHEFFLSPGAICRTGDSGTWGDGTRYKIVKVYHNPMRTIVWADRLRAA